jgi:uncharacterized protein (DUF885 family)
MEARFAAARRRDVRGAARVAFRAMKTPPVCAAVLLFLVGCASGPDAHPTRPAASPADAAYDRLAEGYLADYLAWRPQEGPGLGLHEYDGRVGDLSRGSIEKERLRLHAARDSFASIDPATLSAGRSTSLRALRASIDGELFGMETQKTYFRNPMTYVDHVDVNVYVKRNYAPIETRAKAVVAALGRVPATVAEGRRNLDETLPRTFVETAVTDGKGFVEFLNGDLVTALEPLDDAAVRAQFTKAKNAAAAAMTDFVQWLETERLPKSDGSFALGRDAFARMLRSKELIEKSPEEILAVGTAELAREQAAFAAAARAIDPSAKPIDVFKSIQRDHPTAESLIPDAKKNLEAIRKFVADRGIVTLPSDVRVKVDETPRYARATSFASMDSPGPFETVATEAFYYVTPVEPEWTPEHKEEWLTSFNYFTTDVVSIHEAYPGHYVQFLHLNASDASRADKVFGSYAFIEGWAHYCEEMLIDQGFGAGADPVAAAKYRLAQSDEALLRICRLCMSIRMHCDGWTVEQATRFFMENCHYEEAPAKAEATRGTYDPGYLFYTLGKLEFRKLRDDWRRQEGDAYSLRRFHDEVLAHGMPPVRLLRELMLKDASKWAESL